MKKIFTLFLITFSIAATAKTSGLTDGKILTCPTAAIAYASSSFCAHDALQAVTLTGTDAYLGGTFSSTPGLMINSITGEIAPVSSAAGTYTITYNIPPNGPCPAIVATTVVTIDLMPGITLSSAAGTANQTVCSNVAITNINYSVTNASVTVTGLPTGVTETYAGGVLAISGTPTVTGIFNYTVNTVGGGGCPAASVSGTITVGGPTLTATTTGSICSGGNTNIVLSSNRPNTTYSWNIIRAGVMGGTQGSNTTGVINDILTTTGSSPGTATYSIVPYSNGCPGPPRTIVYTVFPIPTVTASPGSLTICSGNTTNINLSGNVAGTNYTWTALANGVYGANAGSGNNINQTLVANTAYPGTVEYIITPIINGCYGAPVSVMVTVNPTPQVIFAVDSHVLCSGEMAMIHLSSSNPQTTFIWTVVESGVTGAMAGNSSSNIVEIAQQLSATGPYNGTANYTIVPILNGCSGDPISITFTVYALPRPMLADGFICLDENGNTITPFLLDSGLHNGNYTFEWSYNGVTLPETESTYIASTPGQYSLVVTSLITACISDIQSVTVIGIEPGTVTSTQTEQPDGNYTITVNATGTGIFEYFIDGTLNDSNVFTDVPFGLHTITVMDLHGCTDITIELDLPEFEPQGGLTVGPNPVTDIVTLRNATPINKITVFNQLGQAVFEQEYNSKTVEVNLSDLNSGIYFISTDSNSNKKTKIVKN